jgi:hypothetical protein
MTAEEPFLLNRHTNRIFTVQRYKDVIVKEIREGLYSWKMLTKTDAPAPIDFTIKFGSATFGMRLEDGEESATGEWLSRRIGQIIPPFEWCQIVGRSITHPKESATLWTRAPPLPAVREKERVLEFDMGGKKFTSK